MRELMKSCKHIPFIYEFAKAVNARLQDRSFKHVDDPSYWDTKKTYDESPYLWSWILEPRYGLKRTHLQEYIDLLAALPPTFEHPVVIQYPRINDWCQVDEQM